MPKLSAAQRSKERAQQAEAAVLEAAARVRWTALRDLLELYDHAAGGENWTVQQTVRLAEIRRMASFPLSISAVFAFMAAGFESQHRN